MVAAIKKKQGVTEELKARDQLARVSAMNKYSQCCGGNYLYRSDLRMENADFFRVLSEHIQSQSLKLGDAEPVLDPLYKIDLQG